MWSFLQETLKVQSGIYLYKYLTKARFLNINNPCIAEMRMEIIRFSARFLMSPTGSRHLGEIKTSNSNKK